MSGCLTLLKWRQAYKTNCWSKQKNELKNFKINDFLTNLSQISNLFLFSLLLEKKACHKTALISKSYKKQWISKTITIYKVFKNHLICVVWMFWRQHFIKCNEPFYTTIRISTHHSKRFFPCVIHEWMVRSLKNGQLVSDYVFLSLVNTN